MQPCNPPTHRRVGHPSVSATPAPDEIIAVLRHADPCLAGAFHRHASL